MTTCQAEFCHETPPLGMIFSQWARAAGTLRLWSRNAKTRRRLADLDDRALRDVGLIRSTALLESERAFWE